MRLLIVILLFSIKASATNYAISSSVGSDGGGCSLAAPCQTIAKANTLGIAGDSIFFKGADTWSETLRPRTGVYYGTYGTGKAIITGFTTLSGWSSLGSGIYQAACSGCNVNTNILLMDGIQQPIARFPNTGYRTYSSFSTNVSITDPSLTGTPNWTGGYVVIRNNQYTLSTNLITNHTTNTITYTAATSQNGSSGFGYFIINDSLALDALGEWIYSASGNIKMYFGGNTPSTYTVKTTAIDTLINIPTNLKNITINNFDLEGAGIYGIYIEKDTNVNITNCTIKYSGASAVLNNQGYACRVSNCYIQYANDIGLYAAGNSVLPYFGYDTVMNSGTMPGQGRGLQGNNYKGIFSAGLKGIVEYCKVDTSGYDGIHGYNDSSINHNSVDYFCYILDDGGGIYHLGFTDTTLVHNIDSNVVTNGIGASAGSNTATTFANGVYVDTKNFGVRVRGNSIYNCSNAGIYFHNSKNSSALYNTIYACGKYQLYMQGDDATRPINNMTIKNNIYGLSLSTQLLVRFAAFNSVRYNNSYGVSDSNYYSWAPSITTPFNAGLGQTYSQWKDSTADSHATLLPASLLFQYNSTNANSPASLSNNYIDARNVKYYLNILIPPLSALMLFQGSYFVIPRGVRPNNQ